jgi:HD-GYP domain-containing protein (c-di-GMP phosphodiesterase class II)
MDQKNLLLKFIEQLVKYHDPYADGHAANTAALTVGLARASRYDESRLDELRIAASLHDVGKIIVPEYILNKIGKLTRNDYAQIQRHPLVGFDLLHPLGLGNIVECVVLQHHECYDGTGYPRGLKGESICLEARLVKIADTFDAMTSERPYRNALDVESAVRLMEKESRLFDSILLEVFIRHVLGL